jgi:hypothetical protein
MVYDLKDLVKLLPLFFFLLATEANINLSTRGGPVVAERIVTGNLFIYGGIYLIGVLILLATWKESRQYVENIGYPLTFLFILVLFSLLRTVSPLSVLKETVHFAGIFLIASLSAVAYEDKPVSFFFSLILFFLVSIHPVYTCLLPFSTLWDWD